MAKAKSADNAKAQVKDYIAALPADTRRSFRKLRALIAATAPGVEEAFSYRIPCFKLDGKPLVWYAAFKNHMSLFPMTDAIRRRYATDLEGYETSKGTVRIPLNEPLPAALVKKLVTARITEVRASGR